MVLNRQLPGKRGVFVKDSCNLFGGIEWVWLNRNGDGDEVGDGHIHDSNNGNGDNSIK